MLPGSQQYSIIKAVTDSLGACGFDFQSCSVLSAFDEAVFEWIAVNFLEMTQREHKHGKFTGVMQISGGTCLL